MSERTEFNMDNIEIDPTEYDIKSAETLEQATDILRSFIRKDPNKLDEILAKIDEFEKVWKL